MLAPACSSAPTYKSATVVWSAMRPAVRSTAAELQGQSCSTVSYAAATLGQAPAARARAGSALASAPAWAGQATARA
jgi:hypothetical protein